MSHKSSKDEFYKAFENDGIIEKPSINRNETYKNLNFLEKEKKRLEKLKEIITKKFFTLKKHSHLSLLIIKEETTAQELKARIISRVVEVDSLPNQRLRQMFQDSK